MNDFTIEPAECFAMAECARQGVSLQGASSDGCPTIYGWTHEGASEWGFLTPMQAALQCCQHHGWRTVDPKMFQAYEVFHITRTISPYRDRDTVGIYTTRELAEEARQWHEKHVRRGYRVSQIWLTRSGKTLHRVYRRDVLLQTSFRRPSSSTEVGQKFQSLD